MSIVNFGNKGLIDKRAIVIMGASEGPSLAWINEAKAILEAV